MLPPQDCDIPDEVCCDVLVDIAQHLLDTTFTVLDDCWDDTGCGGLLAYLTMGEGDDGVVDSLTVDFNTTVLLSNALLNGVLLANARSQATFTVRLRESGWPVAQRTDGGVVIAAPDPIIQNALARHVFAHGERMHRHLMYLGRTKGLTPSTVTGCTGGVVGPLTPLRPRGGVVGWSVDVTVGLPW